MQTPPCPVCGTPLRWFPEMNAWGCDRCQQMMMPAAPPPAYGQKAAAAPNRTRTWILFGLLVVATGGVIIMLATDKKSKGIDCDAYVEKSVALATAGRTGDDLDVMTRRVTSIAENNCLGGSVSEEEAECVQTSATHDELLKCLGLGGSSGGGASAEQPAPQPPPASPPPPTSAATTPRGAPINIPECAEVAVLRKQVEACAAIPEDIKTTLYSDADNKMSVFDTSPPTGDYAEMVRGKCAGTAASLRDSLAQASCK